MNENLENQIVRATVHVPVYGMIQDKALLKTLTRQLSALKCHVRLGKEKPAPVRIRVIPNSQRVDCIIELQIVMCFRADKWKYEENDSVKKCFDSFCSEAEFRLQDLMDKLVIASNIALPGSVNIWDGGIFFCEGHSEFRSRYKLFRWAIRSELYKIFESFDKKPRWPKIKRLPLDKVWKWLQNFPDFRNGYGTTPLGRALMSFTYLFTHEEPNSGNDDSFPLLWLMPIVGLEAIYESGSAKRVLKERCELFLKWPTKKKKFIADKIDELYKKRDSLIHGGLNLCFKFGFNPKFEDSWEAVWLLDDAIPIFVATLQKMVESDIHRLQFELRLKT